MATNKTMIRVDESTYSRLFALKKGYSFNEYLSEVATYFERNNINPFHVQGLPSERLEKDHDRIIKILKAQEKKYVDLFISLGDEVGYLRKIFSSVSDIKDEKIPLDVLTSEGLTYETLAEVAENISSNPEIQAGRKAEADREKQNTLESILAVLEEIREGGTVVQIGENSYAYSVTLSVEKQLTEVNKILSNPEYRNIAFLEVINTMTNQEYEKIPCPKDEKQERILVFKAVLDGVYDNISKYVH